MSQISKLSPSSSFCSSTMSFDDCPQMTTAIDELHQVNSTIRVGSQLGSRTTGHNRPINGITFKQLNSNVWFT